ncbi:UNVERIFIED_CONTAM: hypothetical protein HHA_450410 [Hammondia hammondi]|eukprot:XP_008889400.1 hypothetical protein HHA_450410 [Hammondia hammondi]
MRISVTPDGRSSPNSPALFDAKYLLGKYLREPTTHSGKQLGVVHSLLSSFERTEDIAAGIRAAVLGTRGKSCTRFTERGAPIAPQKLANLEAGRQPPELAMY